MKRNISLENSYHFQACLQNDNKRLLAASCLFIRLSARMEHLRSHWTDFHEIWYLRIFRKSLNKIQVSLKQDKNNLQFTWRTIYIFYHILLSSS